MDTATTTATTARDTGPAHAPPAGPDAGTPAIDAVGLTKVYDGRTVVDHLDLRIERGEIFGLLGPNGAGKTTTILMLLGLTEPTEGRVTVAGLDPRRQALDVKGLVGYLPDDVGFYDHLTGRQNLRYTAALNRLPRQEAEQRIERVLADVGLTDAADRKARTYSRGMRQRLGLADALVKDPQVLVLDEPTVNIDPAGVHELLALIRRLRDERGMTILLSSHLLHQVEAICDRVGIFLGGRLLACGTVADLARDHDDRWVVDVEADGSADAVSAALAQVSREVGGEVGGGPVRFTVQAAADPRDAIVRALADHRLPLRHLARRGADLDAVYRRWFGEAA